MSRILCVVALAACGCHDWDQFSRAYVGGVETTFDGGGKALCSTNSARFCDDFEGSLNNNWGLPDDTKSGGSWDFDSSKAVSGSQSLRLHLDDLSAGASVSLDFTENTSFANGQSGSFYARVFVWGSNLVGDFAFMSAIANGGKYSGLHVGVNGDGNLELTDWANGNDHGQSVYVDSDASITAAGWSCLEWHIVASSAPGATDGSASVSINGHVIPALDFATGLDTVPADDPLGFLTLGLQTSQVSVSTAGFDTWFDDFVVASDPIGCAP